MDDLCDEMGLSLVKARGSRPDRAMGEVNGWYVSVSYHEVFLGFGNAQNLTEFSVFYAQPTEFNFIIKYGRSLTESKRKRFVYQREGPEIENNYYLKTSDEADFGKFLKQRSWRNLFASRVPVRLMCGEDKGLGHSELYYHSTSFVYESQKLKTILESMVLLIDHMREIGFADLAGDEWLHQNVLGPIEYGKVH